MTSLTPDQTLTTWDRHSHTQTAVHDPRLPSWCPSWCTTNHPQLIAEGCPDDDVAVHSATEGEGTLDEIRNSASDRVTRQGGGSGDVSAERDRLNLETVNLTVSGGRASTHPPSR